MLTLLTVFKKINEAFNESSQVSSNLRVTIRTVGICSRTVKGPSKLPQHVKMKCCGSLRFKIRKTSVELNCRFGSSCNFPHTVQRKEMVSYGFN